MNNKDFAKLVVSGGGGGDGGDGEMGVGGGKKVMAWAVRWPTSRGLASP